jgi:hypothetical protein
MATRRKPKKLSELERYKLQLSLSLARQVLAALKRDNCAGKALEQMKTLEFAVINLEVSSFE